MVEAVIVITTLGVLLFGLYRIGAAALRAQQGDATQQAERWQARMEALDAW